MARLTLDPRVLIAGNSGDIEAALCDLLSGYHPAVATGGDSDILAAVRDRSSVRLVVLCDRGSDLHGLNLLQEIKRVRPAVAVLLVSAHPTVEHATEAIRRGAEDF